MTQHHDDFAEQLSAFMDGELPDAEARFLLRRLEHDAELRAKWTRMQLGSHSLRGQPWQLMEADLATRVAAGIAGTAPAGLRRPLLRWAVAASVLALALVMAPRLLQPKAVPEATIAEVPAAAADHIVASPASADLVALRAPAPAPAPAASEPASSADPRPLVATAERSERASPLPLSASTAESPSDFPLVDTGEERRWPRSELVGASSDPAIEAYLVRHNQMLANDGLGGFVPYVDVVANGRPASTPEAAPDDSGDKQ